MHKRIFKLASLLLSLAILLTSLMTSVSAQSGYTVSTLSTGENKNPIYADVDGETSYAVTPKVYYSNENDFDTSLCISDADTVISNIRQSLVDREGVVDIYYKDYTEYNTESCSELIADWFNKSLEETENSVEGDYLRYVYGGYRWRAVRKVYYGDAQFYYHITINVTYYTSKSQEEELDAKLKEVIDGFYFGDNTTDIQKFDIIYNYITDNVRYDYDNLDDKAYKLKYTAYAALINKTAVCQGYATLFYRMARECGLSARVVVGTSREQNHAWNIVKINDLYYYLDSTWDEGRTQHFYYLKGADTFEIDHNPEEKFLQTAFRSEYPISETDYVESDDIFIEGLYKYKLSLGKAQIVKYTGTEKNVVTPTTLGGYTVNKILFEAFDFNDYIETLTISEGVTAFEERAVVGCNSLKTINFPSTIVFYYDEADAGVLAGMTTLPEYCEKLEKITVAQGNTSIKVGEDGILYSYDGKTLLLCPTAYNKETVTIPEGVTGISTYAFNWCEGIKEIKLPSTIKLIGYNAFCNATSLENINIPEGCEFIAQLAFMNTKIEEIYIPASIEYIMSSAFAYCNLKNITISDENETYSIINDSLMSYNAEEDVYSLCYYINDGTDASYTVPDKVVTIEQYAFYNADNLKEIILPSSLQSVWSYAFEDCDGFTHIEIPSNVKTIENYAFINCDSIASIIIPESVTEIGEMVIFGNDGCTFYGVKGSAADSYAKSNSIKFKTVDQFICTSGHNMKKSYINEFSWHMVCESCGDASISYELTDIGNIIGEAELNKFDFEYTGKPIRPVITSFKFGKEFVEGVDYVIEGYFDNINVGGGYIKIKGIGECAGTGYIYFNILPIAATSKEIKLEYTSTVFDGYEKYPEVTVKGLERFVDYDVCYVDNLRVGTAKAVINFFGNYYGEVTKEFEIYLPSVKKLSATHYGSNDIKLSWTKVYGADGYCVYYKNSASSSYSFKAKTENLYYNFANLPENKAFSFKVVPYFNDGVNDLISSRYKTVNAKTLTDLKAPSKVSLKLYGYNDVKVSWSKVANAKGYYVYYKKASSSKYIYAGKTTATSFKKANLSDGVKCDFKIIPYGISDGKVILDESYKTASVCTLKKVSTPKLSKASSSKVKVSWENIAGESGYQISKATSKSKTSIACTYSTTSGKSKTLSAARGKTYYYKVRAFVKVGSVKIYGPWSKAKAYTLK